VIHQIKLEQASVVNEVSMVIDQSAKEVSGVAGQHPLTIKPGGPNQRSFELHCAF
jgi:hypothetical protein